MKIHTQKDRQTAIAAKNKGLTFRQIAEVLDTHARTVQRWLHEYEKSGKDGPNKRGHRPPALTTDDLQRIQVLLISQPDLTLRQIKEELDLSCYISTLHDYIRTDLGWKYKKNSARQGTGSAGRYTKT